MPRCAECDGELDEFGFHEEPDDGCAVYLAEQGRTTDMPMEHDGTPVYVRRVDDPRLTAKRPQHVYETDLRTAPAGCPLYGGLERKVVCQLTTNTNESMLWCQECAREHEYTQMKKSYQEMGTSFATVWQHTDIPNLTTGRVETDPKKFAIHLREQSEIMGERLGMKVDYQPVDMTDKDALGVTDEGLDATHDRAVAEGRKDSRGRFVF